VEGIPGGVFRIHDPLTGTEYFMTAQSLQARMTATATETTAAIRLGGALFIDL
jgi:hypothetical protein